jgi:hypothetical protein
MVEKGRQHKGEAMATDISVPLARSAGLTLDQETSSLCLFIFLLLFLLLFYYIFFILSFFIDEIIVGRLTPRSDAHAEMFIFEIVHACTVNALSNSLPHQKPLKKDINR